MESAAERWNETYPDRPIELQAETLGCDDLHNNLTISLQSGTGTSVTVQAKNIELCKEFLYFARMSSEICRSCQL